MYGLPEDFSCAFFVGRTLEMLCFNANQIYLHFGKQTSVCVEGTYSIAPSGSDPKVFEVPDVNTDLFKLIERAATSASGVPDGTLTLAFDNDLVFRCYDSKDNYECYKITHDNQITIV
jgi:hypothetical protein